MKRIGMISTVALSLALGVGTMAFAQEQRDQQEEQKAKPAQEEKKAQPEKSAKPEQKPTAQKEKTAKPEENNAQQQSKDIKSEQKNAQQQDKNSRNAEKHAQQAEPGKQEQRASGNGGGRIPDDRFKANFGEQHRFRVTQADYSTSHRFQYGGYWFGFADPWPSNWLYTQDVYVIEINGVYYLCNPMYPGVNLALSFTL